VRQKEPVGVLIAVARLRLRQMVASRVAAHGLTPQQFWALINIDEADGPSLSQIAERLRMDAPRASRAVTQLLKRRWVAAEGDRGDRRRLRLRLTHSGRGKIAHLRMLAAKLRSAAFYGLMREEEATLRALLHKIIANLDRPGGEA